MECVSDRAYDNREQLATDIVRILREEIAYLLAEGTALIQLDEPVPPRCSGNRARAAAPYVWPRRTRRARRRAAFAQKLLGQVTEGFPTDRLAPVCAAATGPPMRRP